MTRAVLVICLVMVMAGDHCRRSHAGSSPTPDESLFRAAESDWAQSRWQLARARYEELIAMHPNSPWVSSAHTAIALHDKAEKRYPAAIARYDEVIRRWPNQQAANNARLGKAMVYFNQEQWNQVKTVLDDMQKRALPWQQVKAVRYLQKRVALERFRAPRRRAENNCGVMALAHAMRLKGASVSETTLAQLIRPGRQGASMWSLVQAARSNQVSATGWKCDLAAVSPRHLPAVALLKRSHFVVIEGLGAGQITVYDPETRVRSAVSTSDFQQQWSGYLVSLGTTSRPATSRKDVQLLTSAAMQRLWGANVCYCLICVADDLGPGSCDGEGGECSDSEDP